MKRRLKMSGVSRPRGIYSSQDVLACETFFEHYNVSKGSLFMLFDNFQPIGFSNCSEDPSFYSFCHCKIFEIITFVLKFSVAQHAFAEFCLFKTGVFQCDFFLICFSSKPLSMFTRNDTHRGRPRVFGIMRLTGDLRLNIFRKGFNFFQFLVFREIAVEKNGFCCLQWRKSGFEPNAYQMYKVNL